MNAMTHGGYSTRDVVSCGALREDPDEHERNLKAFLDALKPRNAAALRCAERIFREYCKLDRVDRYEILALERAGHMPEVDPNFDLRVELAESRYLSAFEMLDMWQELLDDYDQDPSALTFNQWQSLRIVANDPSLAHLEALMDETDGSSDEHRDALIPMLRSVLEQHFTERHGSVGNALEEHISKAHLILRIREAERDALHEPPTEAEHGAQVAHALIDGGFFDRLVRSRSTILRAICHLLDQFTRFQELPSDETDAA